MGILLLAVTVALCSFATPSSAFQQGHPHVQRQSQTQTRAQNAWQRSTVAAMATSKSKESGNDTDDDDSNDNDNDNDNERVSHDGSADEELSPATATAEPRSVLPPITNLAFDDVAESPAPPLNYQKYLTMQKKRVPVTIRYSAESGLKPYCLTVAKRVKDEYPDVVIEGVEVDDGRPEDSGSGDSPKTFEVIVDGKLVVRTQKMTASQRSSGFSSGECVVFVSMNEMDAAITRARKRRRPSTVYGEHGMTTTYDNNKNDNSKDRLVKARLEALKLKSTELQRTSSRRPDIYAAATAATTTGEDADAP
eukprot:jgi/Psemu1/291350/fgenesh1_pg.683_\